MTWIEVRAPCARPFYPSDCAQAVQRFLKGFSPPSEPNRIVAGIVPHAGWQYSGAVAAKVFASVRAKEKPETFVIFGAVHRWVDINAVYVRGAWSTPLGNVEVDETLAARILEEAGEWVCEDPRAHSGEHSIEVQLPFLKSLFPEARIVPIAVNPDARAVPLGQQVGKILQDYTGKGVVIGSTDLTHYGDVYSFTPVGYGPQAHEWVRENDARILRLAEQMQATEIPAEASRHHNACGAGAMAATVAAAQIAGAQHGYLLDYTTSYDVAPEDEFRMAVGYAGLLF
ncbi:MAG: AmmeMemoRadiSam system protein B [Acidobacteria bacterium]|nr:AmmeMemoRadiSam system protein B [Acidobacteriota bacterium]